MTRVYAIAAAIVIAGVLGFTGYKAMYGTSSDPFAECRTGKIAGGAGAIGGPFTLVDEDGKTVTDKDVITKPSLIYFGYTFCPDVCPLDNARNAEAVDILDKRGYDVTPIFISIDPKRDTPAVMRDFTENMSPKMIGLTGTPEQVKAASRAYKTYYKVQDPSQEYYLIDHSTFTYLVFPKIGFVDFFKRDETPKEMADRVACFIDKSKEN
ncbi:SCO family protein [Acidimangrovimonas pyrenivorans]|uniref:SCO family protein n=1 Tax=Acidimangrovimonas pyrenivorans TaxID=2030798 RepID=A0ABV7AL77_9RHOB